MVSIIKANQPRRNQLTEVLKFTILLSVILNNILFLYFVKLEIIPKILYTLLLNIIVYFISGFSTLIRPSPNIFFGVAIISYPIIFFTFYYFFGR